MLQVRLTLAYIEDRLHTPGCLRQSGRTRRLTVTTASPLISVQVWQNEKQILNYDFILISAVSFVSRILKLALLVGEHIVCKPTLLAKLLSHQFLPSYLKLKTGLYSTRGAKAVSLTWLHVENCIHLLTPLLTLQSPKTRFSQDLHQELCDWSEILGHVLL